MNYSFDTELAEKIGVNEAIMLNNFVYWLSKNKANNKNLFDGNFWTYNSVKAYCDLFPFWTESQIKRIIKSLIDQNVLVVGNYNQNAYDRTNWYALSSGYIHLIHWTISTNGEHENDQPIPNINTDVNSDKKQYNKKINKKEIEFSVIDEKESLSHRTIDYLNLKINKNFGYTKGNLKEILSQISKLLKANNSFEEIEDKFAHVINVKCSEWLNNEEMKKHLNPITLFREVNFDRYLNQDLKLDTNDLIDALYKARECR